MKFFILSERSSSPHPEAKFEQSSYSRTYPRQMSGICDTQGRIGITLSVPLLHPAQTSIAFVLQNPAGLELPYFPHFGDTVFLHCAFESKLPQYDLGNEDGTVSFPSCASQEAQRLPSAGQTPQNITKCEGGSSLPWPKPKQPFDN